MKNEKLLQEKKERYNELLEKLERWEITNKEKNELEDLAYFINDCNCSEE